MDRKDIVKFLKESNPHRLKPVWEKANSIRKNWVGDAVHLRGLVEFSNYCDRGCKYCGINCNRNIKRYHLSKQEIIQSATRAEKTGYGTVVLQSGENDKLSPYWLAFVIKQIKENTDLAVTLSVGEKDFSIYKLWRESGADRYLLRFETSNKKLFNVLHPQKNQKLEDRVIALKNLQYLGYEIGSGMMVGIPGQSYENLAEDILFLKKLDLDMIGLGPFIPHPQTELYSFLSELKLPPNQQVKNNDEMVYKTLALARILCPQANIPSTTGLSTISRKHGRKNALNLGANVIMPNVTPQKYRKLYEIYPDKFCYSDDKKMKDKVIREIKSLNRTVGKGRGDCVRNIKDKLKEVL